MLTSYYYDESGFLRRAVQTSTFLAKRQEVSNPSSLQRHAQKYVDTAEYQQGEKSRYAHFHKYS